MDDSFRPPMRSATPEHFLELLRDQHRQACGLCGFDPETDLDAKLSFATTVAQWRAELDLLPCRELADALNQIWGIECPRDEWKAALEPEKQRTLEDVCNLLARHVKLPIVKPMGLLGASCLPAGVFLTVRSLLRDAGADPSQIAPSTALADYAKTHFETFLGPISWLAPGAVPQVRIHNSLYDMAVWGIVVGLVMILAGYLVPLTWVPILGGITVVISYCLTCLAAGHLGPSRVEFGELKTFRDLSMAIARAQPETHTHAK